MESPKEINETCADAVQEEFHYEFHAEVKLGNELINEAKTIFGEMFEEDSDLESVKEKHIQLLKKMKTFEDNLINVEILNFLYAIISRTALNAYKFDDAIRYALAGIEANQKQKDQEGVDVNQIVLLDTACFMGAHKEAIKIFDKYPNIADPAIKKILNDMTPNDMPSKADTIFKKIIQGKQRPRSLVFCLDDKRRIEEKVIKTLMRQMGISRKVALKYKEFADKLISQEEGNSQ